MSRGDVSAFDAATRPRRSAGRSHGVWKLISAKYPGECGVCGGPFSVGDRIAWQARSRTVHELCASTERYALEDERPASHRAARLDYVAGAVDHHDLERGQR